MEYNLIPSFFPNIHKVKFVSKKILKQHAYARGSNAIRTDYGDRTSWVLPLPEEVTIQISHTWDNYESIASRLASKVADVHTAIADFQGLKGAASGAYSSVSAADDTISVNAAIGAARAAAAGAQTTEVPAYRVDSSLVYKDSSRREFTFSITLIDSIGDPYNTLFKPITELMKLSCPEMQDGDLIGINFPNIFEIYSVGSDLVKINNAALTSIMPVWKPPYINNYPTVCELTLNVRDIEPLFRRSFDQGGIIRTNDSQPEARTSESRLTNSTFGR